MVGETPLVERLNEAPRVRVVINLSHGHGGKVGEEEGVSGMGFLEGGCVWVGGRGERYGLY